MDTDLGDDLAGHPVDRGRHRRREAWSRRQVGRLNRIDHQPAREPAEHLGQRHRLAEAETVRAGRAGATVLRPVQGQPVDPAGMGRIGPDRVHHDGQWRTIPELDQAARFTVAHGESDAGQVALAQPPHHGWTDTIVAAELVTHADHHDRPARRSHDRSRTRSRKWVAQEMQGS